MTDVMVSGEEQTKQLAVKAAHHYLQTVKQWRQEEYHLEFVNIKDMEGMSVVVLEGIHEADLNNRQRGGGQSVQLYVDAQSHRVLRELAYQ